MKRDYEVMKENFSETIPISIGPYQVLKKIGQGGMGEIFLVYDPVCQRQIALKRFRSDKAINKKLRNQFLAEAKITSQLVYPGIIPIYSIVDQEKLPYYTMPYIEGKNLKEIFTNVLQNEKATDPLSTVSQFTSIFLHICLAVSYAHSKGVIHRDLKPSNILVGHQGEVFISDWGLVEAASDIQMKGYGHEGKGKISGTIPYLAPELVIGKHPTKQSEIYSLGLIFYQMLTLRYPFHRSNMEQYAQNFEKETLIDPAKAAPERDIHPFLSHIALKCLDSNPDNRYQSVDEIIYDLNCYLTGCSKWVKMAELSLQNETEWFRYKNIKYADKKNSSLSVSKEAFEGNIKIEAEVTIQKEGYGIGFLFNTEKNKKGYCIWLAAEGHSSTGFYKNQKLLTAISDIYLKSEQNYQIRIEVIRHNLYLYLDGMLKFSYLSYLPQEDSQVGILLKDNLALIPKYHIFMDGKRLQGDHLAVADAFFAYKDYSQALNEYRKVASFFSHVQEGRDALFQAGVVWLKEARLSKNKKDRQKKIKAALNEFSRLQESSSAPLAYLGQIFIYQELKDLKSEIKMWEYAFQHYAHHALITLLKDHLSYRLMDCVNADKKECFELILLALRFLPFHRIAHILNFLNQKLEPVYFLDDIDQSTEEFQRMALIIHLAFLLAHTDVLSDCIDELLTFKISHLQLLEGAFLALIEWGAIETVQKKLDQVIQIQLDIQAQVHFGWIYQLIDFAKGSSKNIHKEFLSELPKQLTKQHMHFVICFLNEALKQNQKILILDSAEELLKRNLSQYQRLQIDDYCLWVFLQDRNLKAADYIIKLYRKEKQKTEFFQFLYKCWQKAKGFQVSLPLIKASFFPWLMGQNDQKYALFYLCANQIKKSQYYKKLLKIVFK